MTYAGLEQKLSRIPAGYLDEVSEYLDFVLYRASAHAPAKDEATKRSPGGISGGVWMAEDFDAPLDAFDEYE